MHVAVCKGGPQLVVDLYGRNGCRPDLSVPFVESRRDEVVGPAEAFF
jgi:hypothetical protein